MTDTNTSFSMVPTSASTSTTTSQDNIENIKNIQSLQQTEKEILDSLEAGKEMTPELRQQIIDKVNALSDMRINLYKVIGSSVGMYQNNLNKSNNLLIQQTGVIDNEEKNLNEYKKKLRMVTDKNMNELRLIEINNYYSEKYSDHANIAIALIMLLSGLIVIHFLYHSGILPDSIYWALVFILTSYLAYRFWNVLLSAYRRNNMNYNQFDFTPPSASTSATVSTNVAGTTSDPWFKLPETCVGQACCTSGMIFDDTQNLCIVQSAGSTNITTSIPSTV